MKFGSLVQNDSADCGNMVESKPEAQIQYGGRLFFQTGKRLVMSQLRIEL